MRGLNVSIIICTRNRAESLRLTLSALAHCAVPASLSVELLIVDNASTDHTPLVVRRASLPNLPVRYVREPRPGLSHARNCGLAHTAGQVILFTDDDVRPPVNWIELMCLPILSGQADAVAGGVHVPPHYDAILSRPPYRARRGWFACNGQLEAGLPARMVGANMAFSRAVADRVGQFDAALGAGALGFFEEYLFCAQMLAAGFRLLTRLEISVEHHFELERIGAACLVDMAERMGRSEAYVAHHWERQPAPTLWQVTRAQLGLRARRWLRRDAQDAQLLRLERTTVLEGRYALRNTAPKYRPNAPEDHPTEISILIATRNRAPALAATLDSLAGAAVPRAGAVEVILIDNGSTDATPEVMARFRPPYLHVRVLTEPACGKSRALNAGLAAAHGQVLLFTDDDVRVPADWIARMSVPLLSGACDAAVGGIAPGPGRETGGMFLTPALFDPLTSSEPLILIGANMAIHRRVIETVGGFDPELGPGAIGMGEDTHLSHRIEQAGFRLAAIPDATVEHYFDLHRCDDESQRKASRQLARAKAYMDAHFHRRKAATSWLGALKSWLWLARRRARRVCFGPERCPLTGWELHQEAEVAYFLKSLQQVRIQAL